FSGGGKVVVLKRGQQLTGMHALAALHIEFLDRSGDLGLDRSLCNGRKDGISRDLLRDRAVLRLRRLHRYDCLRRLFLLAAGEEREWQDARGENRPVLRGALRIVDRPRNYLGHGLTSSR